MKRNKIISYDSWSEPVIRRITAIILLCFSCSSLLYSQTREDQQRKELLKTIGYSDPDLLSSPSGSAPGFPGRPGEPDLLDGFRNPPPGYGEVPFWWWSGDPLDKERLLWQIEELHKKGISGMQVNYIHRDSPGWPTWSAEPEIFTSEWWEMWNFAAGEASKRNMGIGLSGYTIDWPGTVNLFNRIIYSDTEIQGREIIADTVINTVKGNNVFLRIPDDAIEVRAYYTSKDKIIPGGKSLMGLVNDGVLTWEPENDSMSVWVFCARRRPGTLNPVHPLAGKKVIEKFFQPFESDSSALVPGGLNYFFQDELKFGVGDLVWHEDLRDEFRKSKGYDLFEMLPGMFTDIGRSTTKSRLDFMDVKVRLSEERYFKPIFEWHYSRGMIYGCDPEGRGKIPGEYGDNFRANRWYTAPGHDTPSGNADLIKGKVSSSIAALYRRPRVWLEGYHSLGWGATPAQLMFATCENYLYGCNLLNLHGLYYTTHGSFWEWAPPCYHFRMPYWDHMPLFLKYFERLSWLMSHGVLQADVAILYPVSTAQAKTGEKRSASLAFASGTTLFNNGYDFLFIDDQSVIRGEIADGRLNVTDQSFKVLILPAMEAIRWTTLTRALEFFRKGGTVIACGSLPEASDNAGSSDPELDTVVRELFGFTAEEINDIQVPSVRKHPSGGTAVFVKDENQLLAEVERITARHVTSDAKVRYAHRKAGNRDIFLVMDAVKDSWCTFAAKGVAEMWDPWSGTTIPLETRLTDQGTLVRMPLSAKEAQIIVFSPESSPADTKGGKEIYMIDALPGDAVINLDGDWEFELKPTMDNRWGDFRLPVTVKMIGAEARIFRYAEYDKPRAEWMQPGFDDSGWEKVTYGFGRKFWKLGPLPDGTETDIIEKNMRSLKMVNPDEPVIINGRQYYWKPYSFSWRSGVEGDPGHQGYHGLKGEITDEFICLGMPQQGLNQTLYKKEKEGSLYYLWTTARAENVTNVTIDAGGLMPSEVFINGLPVTDTSSPVTLRKGSNPVLLKYNAAGRGHFVLISDEAKAHSGITPLSMKWWDMPGRLAFDVRPDERRPAGLYRFTAPPGLQELTFTTHGRLRVWVDGREIGPASVDSTGYLHKYRLTDRILHNAVVAVRVEQQRGEYGGESFPEPVIIECGKGVSRAGDWSAGSVLENYSGGAWYRKSFTLDEKQSKNDVTVDLGKVIATAEVHVNGSMAGTIVSPPWRLNISEYLRKGENIIEILVYNTLSNHYLTVPTKYRGPALESGLIGPVRLEFREIKK